MSLREKLIEAAAKMLHALDAQANDHQPWQWDEEPDQSWYRENAEAALDAILDALEAETANWQLSVSPLAAGEVYTLIAAVRETGSS